MTLISVALICICALIILLDLRLMRIPNALSLAVLSLFAVKVALVGIGPWLWPQFVLAGVVFALCFAAFALNLLGGGDAKVLPALSLFVPIAVLPQFLFGFGIVMLVSIGTIAIARRHFSNSTSAWAVLRSKKLPLGVPIGIAGCVGILVGF